MTGEARVGGNRTYVVAVCVGVRTMNVVDVEEENHTFEI
jgi:hypothetical protein